MRFFRIDKILNNNVAMAFDDDRNHVIVTGNGLGFIHKTGDVLKEDEIESVYTVQNELGNKRLEALFSEIPFSCIRTAEEIVEFASAALGRSFSQNLAISLADHINFSINQQNAGTYLPNLLANEIERLYPTEYIVGLQGLQLVKKNLGVQLDKSEAGSIAFHIINNSGTGDIPLDTTKIIAGVEGMLDIIRVEMGCDLPVDSSHYARLVTHLKFLMRRVVTGDSSEEDVGNLFLNFDEGQVANISHCMDVIAAYLKQEFNYIISNAERLYLFVHIVAITQLK